MAYQLSKDECELLTLKRIYEMGKESYTDLWSWAAQFNRDVKIYLHWSAGGYNTLYSDYHICITGDGSIYGTTDNLAEKKSHTYMRNSAAIGVSLMCCADASYDAHTLGSCPITENQIDSMAQVVTTLCNALDLTIDIKRVMTHEEAARNADGIWLHVDYSPGSGDPQTKWDLSFLHDSDPYGSGGDNIRMLANKYRTDWQNTEGYGPYGKIWN